MRAFVLCALAVACASEKQAITADNWEDDGLSMLQWKMRRVSDKLHSLTETMGDGQGGHCDLLVIPRNSSHQDCLLRVTAYIEKMGDRPEDLWIRRVKLAGKWLPQQYGFKTGSGQYGEESNYLVRMGTGDWKHPVEILQATDGLMSVAIHNKSLPTRNFEKSLAQEVSLVIGPVTVGVTYATSNKDDRNFNHLDVHLKGLMDVRQQLGGILAEEPPSHEDEDEPSEDKPSEDKPSEDKPGEDKDEPMLNEAAPIEGAPSEDAPKEDAPNEGQQNEGQPNQGQQNEGQQNEGQQNEGQPNEVELKEGKPNEVELKEGKPNEGKPNEGKPNEGKPNEGKKNEGKPNEGKKNEGKPNEAQLNEGQPNEGQPNEGQPNKGQPNEGQPNEGQPNEVELNEEEPNDGDDELQLVQSGTQRSRNTIYKMLPSASSMKFDWCCEEGQCDACHWQ